jgi:hypothetical protein
VSVENLVWVIVRKKVEVCYVLLCNERSEFGVGHCVMSSGNVYGLLCGEWWEFVRLVV